jgi:hypothetical protein
MVISKEGNVTHCRRQKVWDFKTSTGKKNALRGSGAHYREGYKTLIFRGGSLHLKSWYHHTGS